MMYQQLWRVLDFLLMLGTCWFNDRLINTVQSLSSVRLYVTPWTAACQVSLSSTNSQSLLKLMSIKSVIPLQLPHPLLSPSPPAFNLSEHQGLFKWVSSSHQVAIVLELQLISPSNAHSGLDSQESSPTSQFKSFNSLVFSFLYSPTLTFIHDHWKTHSLD